MNKKITYCCHICNDPKQPDAVGKTFLYLGTYGFARDHYYFKHNLEITRDGSWRERGEKK